MQNDPQNSTARPGLAGWQKWMLITVVVGALSAIVIFFNFRVFGLADALPYCGVVLFLVLVSFVTTLHIKRSPVSNRFLTAAFVFEILLCVALGINAAYSLSVLREMSVAGLAEQTQKETLDSVSKLKGSRTQREALKAVGTGGAVRTRQEVFTHYERVLFWIVIGELAIGLLALFVLLGLSVFDKNGNGVPDFLEDQPKPRLGFSAPRQPQPAIAEETPRPKEPRRTDKQHWI